MMNRSLNWSARLRKVVRHQLKQASVTFQGEPLQPIPLGSQTLGQDDAILAHAWLKKPESWFDEQPVREFEVEFARWNGSKHAVAFAAGREALSAAIEALRLKPGDEVIVPAYTCVVVPNAFEFAGIRVVNCDIELDTYGPEIHSVKAHVTERTRAILVHHLYGLVCRDYDELIAYARDHGLFVIEDCAHAMGAFFRGERIGNRSDVAFYSTEGSKVMTTVQGGIAVTNDADIAERLRSYQQQLAQPPQDRIDALLHTLLILYYQFCHPYRFLMGDVYFLRYGHKRLVSTTDAELLGYKPAHYGMKMAGPVASIGLNQLGKVDLMNERRRETADHWHSWCDRYGYRQPMVIKDSIPVWLRYPVLVETERKRDSRWARREHGVELGVWFKSHLHPAARDIQGYPNADEAVARCVNFPTLYHDSRRSS